MSKEFSVSFNDDQLIEILQKQLTGPNVDLLTEAVLGLMGDTEWKKGILLKAALGTKEKCEMPMHQEYWATSSNLSLYSSTDNVAMKERGMMDEQGRIKCRLVGFNPWEFSPYQVEFEIIEPTEGKRELKTGSLRQNQMIPVEEFPGD
jgi:hypothetical protein